jgi:enoyl-CoA hydratase/carnithine racemase
VSDQFRHLLFEVEEGIAAVTLNAVATRNALWFGAGSLREELLAAFARADADDRVGAILVTANGDDFCGGADIGRTLPRESAIEQQRFFEASGRFLEAVRQCAKPTIAGVQGRCLGAGLGLIAQFDLVLAADDARFGLVEGLYGWPGASDLVPAIGPIWAKFLILTGELIPADVAQRIGLLLTTVAPQDLDAAARDLAKRIARTPREGAQLNKRCINGVADGLGRERALVVGRTFDALVAEQAKSARAPDGRAFRDIITQEGIAGLRAATAREPWSQRWATGAFSGRRS